MSESALPVTAGMKRQQKRLVAALLAVLVLVAIGIQLTGDFFPHLPGSIWPTVMILGLVIVGSWALQRDWMRLAVAIVSGTFFLAAALPTLLLGLGSANTGLALFFIPLALAGMMQDRFRLLVTAAATLVTIFVGLWLHNVDLLGAPDGPESPFAVQKSIEFAVAYVIVAVILDRFGRANRRALAESMQREQELASAIVQQQLAEQELERERFFSNAIIDNLPGVFVVIDSTGETVRGNSNIVSDAGYQLEEVNELPIEAFIAPDDVPLLEERIRTALKSGRARATVRLQHRDGRLIPYLFQGSSFLMDGEPHIVALGYDVSEVVEARHAIEELLASVERTNTELIGAYETTIEGWSRALDLRDHETEGHSRRVSDLTVRLAEVLGAPPERLVHIRRGALLHDIGKMGVPDSILLKPGPLTAEERAIMERHTEYAFELLQPIEFLEPALDIPLSHHENWDGSGYPQGLKGEEIPLAARVFSVVDVYDALTNDRPYRAAWTPEQALEHIQAEAGRKFDPAVVDALMTVIRQDPAIMRA